LNILQIILGGILSFLKAKFDNEKFFLLIISLCFLIFITLLSKYAYDKFKKEHNLADKIFEEKKQDINSDIVLLIKHVLDRKDK